jgi:hypothetical protein
MAEEDLDESPRRYPVRNPATRRAREREPWRLWQRPPPEKEEPKPLLPWIERCAKDPFGVSALPYQPESGIFRDPLSGDRIRIPPRAHFILLDAEGSLRFYAHSRAQALARRTLLKERGIVVRIWQRLEASCPFLPLDS